MVPRLPMAEYQQLTLDMSPSLSASDERDRSLSYAVLCSQFHLGQKTGANGKNVSFGKLGAALSFAYRWVASVPSNLVRHIRIVVAKQKMHGIAAGRVVACMQNEASPIPAGVCQEIGNPMGSRFVPSVVSSAVAIRAKAIPLPTIIGRACLDLGPEGFWRVGSHNPAIA